MLYILLIQHNLRAVHVTVQARPGCQHRRERFQADGVHHVDGRVGPNVRYRLNELRTLEPQGKVGFRPPHGVRSPSPRWARIRGRAVGAHAQVGKDTLHLCNFGSRSGAYQVDGMARREGAEERQAAEPSPAVGRPGWLPGHEQQFHNPAVPAASATR